MTSHPNRSKRPCRPRDHLAAAGHLYPDAWRQVDEFRAARGQGGLPNWPDWCFLPLAAAYAIVSADAGAQRLPPRLAADVGRLGALAAWRVGQGIYRFDPTLYDAIVKTPVAGDLPCEILHRLPEWCVYIETPGLEWLGGPLHGVFAHLEWDANTGREELRLLMDAEADLSPVPLHLGAWSLDEALARMLDTSNVWAVTSGMPTAPGGTRELLRRAVEPVISLLLYLCSEAAEIGSGARRPERPSPKRTKKGWRLFPADKPTTWSVGVRLGAALRRAYEAAGEPQGGTHASPRGHIRRAHWHTYWTGPRQGERTAVLKWLPPIPVNIGPDDELPAVVRQVK